jgi:hypothetical protein
MVRRPAEVGAAPGGSVPWLPTVRTLTVSEVTDHEERER